MTVERDGLCPRCGLPTSPLGQVYRSISGPMGLPGVRGKTVCGCPDEAELLHERIAHVKEEIDELREGLHHLDE